MAGRVLDLLSQAANRSAAESATYEIDSLIMAAVVLAIAAVGAVIYAMSLRRESERQLLHYSEVVQDRDSRLAKAREEFVATVTISDSLRSKLSQLHDERTQLQEDMTQQQSRMEELRRRHAPFRKLLHNVCVIGIAGSGKTGLISKLVNPGPVSIKGLMGSGLEERFDRTALVSQNNREGRVEHVISFRVFGGEYKVQAQKALIDMCRTDYQLIQPDLFRRHKVQALVFVVDIAYQADKEKSKDPRAHRFDQARIDEQINKYFNEQAIQFLVEPIRDGLQSIVLFINKFDRLEVDPAVHGRRSEQVEEWVKERYLALINTLRKYTQNHIPVEIIVGSALTDAGLSRLFSTLARDILEKEIRDNQRGPVDHSVYLREGNSSPAAGTADSQSLRVELEGMPSSSARAAG